jgi:hypothetical protein
MAWTVAFAGAGLVMAAAGYVLVKRFETPAERTGFHTVDWARELGYGGGYALLFTGLLAACIGAPMYWILHSR